MSFMKRLFAVAALTFAAVATSHAQMAERPEGDEPPAISAPHTGPQPRIAVYDTAFYTYYLSRSNGYATYMGGVYIGPIPKISAMPLLISLGCHYTKTTLRSNLSYDDQYDCIAAHGGTLFVNYRITDYIVPAVYFYYFTP